jgi:hypothetical protein
MTISIDRYVNITSGVIGAQSVPDREFVGLRFTTDPRVPYGTVVSVDDDGAGQLFGNSAPETVFANQYFSYISPAPASKARTLRFAPWVDADRPARIYGARTSATLAELQAVVAGTLPLTLGSDTVNLTGLDFSAAVTFADVASALQVDIRAAIVDPIWSLATVTYDAVAGAFFLVAGAAGAAPVALGASGAGDVGGLLGWRLPLAIFSPGAAAESPLDALTKAEAVTDSFGSFAYGSTITLAQAIEVATYNAAQNVKYQFYHTVTFENYNAASAALFAIPSVGLILNGLAGEYKESLPMAVFAAIDYNRTNATVNFMYRQGPFANVNDVTDDQTADLLDAARVNYYGTTSKAGQKLAFFQEGFLMGGATAPLDMNVHANEQWLKSALQSDLLSAQLSLNKIQASDEGRGQILVILVGRVGQAKRNGTISVGKELTTLQQIAITQLTGDPDAWRDVQTNGYWADVVIVPETGPGNVTRYVALYTLAYSKNDVVRTIRGSHNLV